MDEDMDWTGQSGAVAWHLIFRHAEDWSETGDMMEAWARAYCGEREAALTARVAELEAALRPFAAEFADYDGCYVSDRMTLPEMYDAAVPESSHLTFADLRRAAALLSGKCLSVDRSANLQETPVDKTPDLHRPA